MTNKNKRHTYIFFFLCIQMALYGQGLQFSSSNELIEDRTAYSVFSKKAELFSEFVEINFALKIIDPSQLGYISFIKDIENNTQYIFSYASNEIDAFFKLSVRNEKSVFQIPVDVNSLGKNRWLQISLKLDSRNSTVKLRIDEDEYSADIDISNKFLLELFFGKHDSFIDLTEMAIKNLEIKGKKKSFTFPFKEFEGNVVHNDAGKEFGNVENPIWLINKSYYWTLRNSLSSESVCAVNFDEERQRFIAVNNDSAFFYNLVNNKSDTLLLKKQSPVQMRLGMSFIPNGLNKMYIYELNDVADEKPTIAILDLKDHTWEACCFDQFAEQKHHHISYFEESSNKFWIFGGFGNLHFSNDFYSYDLSSNTWQHEEFKGDILPPRFISGVTPVSDNKLILFGGAGNPSGDQAIGKIYYRDCYTVDLKTKTITKNWELQDFKHDMVSGRNMILSEDSTSFYAIYYKEYVANTNLNIYKFNIKNGDYEIVGDSIPMISERIRTNATLYKNSFSNELFCVTQEFQLDGSSDINIYSLQNPPAPRSELQKALIKSKNNNLIIILAFVIILSISIILIIRRKRYKNAKLINQQNKLQDVEKATSTSDKSKKNAVYLFGSFVVFDSKGNEISHLFSPKILQLFLLILLNSQGKKVTSLDIYEALWPDKPIEKAKNSKGVTLNQLRKILVDIEGIELKYEQKHLYFEFQNNFYCDYLEFIQLLNDLPKENSDIEKNSKEIIRIASEGRFLLCSDEDCFDQHKQYLENEILKIIPYQIEKNFKTHNYSLVIKLVRILNKIDYGNELAFHYELMSLIKLNMNEKARKKFNAFIVDYKNDSEDDYPHTFRDLVSHKSMEIIKEKSFL